ncbi:MAG: hypothetical protein K5892_02060 [Acholeplasmatales bacterium]|nr:hypothetical protein [Acholeplasmatales bacterium]
MEITYKLQSYRGTQLEVEPNVDGAVIEILVVKIEKEYINDTPQIKYQNYYITLIASEMGKEYYVYKNSHYDYLTFETDEEIKNDLVESHMLDIGDKPDFESEFQQFFEIIDDMLKYVFINIDDYETLEDDDEYDL